MRALMLQPRGVCFFSTHQTAQTSTRWTFKDVAFLICSRNNTKHDGTKIVETKAVAQKKT